MARRHLMRGHSAGKKGLRRVFSRNRTLRTTLGPKAREEALSTLRGFKSGGGITPKELKKSYRKWVGDTKDNITRAQAKVIRRELKEYAKQLENSPHDIRKDARTYLDRIRSGNIRNPRSSDIPASNDTHTYLNKIKDRSSYHGEPEESSGYTQDNRPDRPDNFDDELPPKHERPF